MSSCHLLVERVQTTCGVERNVNIPVGVVDERRRGSCCVDIIIVAILLANNILNIGPIDWFYSVPTTFLPGIHLLSFDRSLVDFFVFRQDPKQGRASFFCFPKTTTTVALLRLQSYRQLVTH